MSHEYRCPVCNHVDAVDLPVGERREVRCGHCATGLTLEVRDDERLTLEVRVAERNEGGSTTGA